MIVRAYLVLSKSARDRSVRVVRATKKRPALAADEAVVRLRLDLPEDAFAAPLITVPVTREKLAVAVEAEEPVEEEIA